MMIDVKTIESMYTSAIEHFGYKKKASPKCFITLSKGVYETTGLEQLSFGTGNDIINYFDSLEFYNGGKETAPMINLWKHKDDRAIAENCVSVSGLMLDIDGGCTIAELEEKFSKYRYCWYTSASHTARVPKFRFVLPFVKALDKHTYKGFIKGIQAELGDMIDQSSVAVGRRFYVPTAPVGKGKQGVKLKGKYLKLEDMFEYDEAVEKEIVYTEKEGLGEMWYDFMLPDIISQFARGFYENNRHQAIVNISTVLGRRGYNADEIFTEMSKVDSFVNRSRYSDNDIMSKINDTLNRRY